MSKQIFAVLLPVLVVGAVIAYVVSSTSGDSSEMSSNEIRALQGDTTNLNKRMGELESHLSQLSGRVEDLRTTTLQLAQAVNDLRDRPVASVETDPNAMTVAAIDVPDSLRNEQAQYDAPLRPEPGMGGPGGKRERDPAKEAERRAEKMVREEEKAKKEGAKLAERLGLDEYQGNDIANLMIEEKRLKSQLEEEKRSGSLSREEFKEREKELKAQTQQAIESMLTADQLELYQQKGKGGGRKGKKDEEQG